MIFRSHPYYRYGIFTECMILFAMFPFDATLILTLSPVRGNVLYSILTIAGTIALLVYLWDVFMRRGTLWTRIWARVFITKWEVQWFCPFLRSHKLRLSECTITVENEYTPQGVHFVYICFSKFPHRELEDVGNMRCSDTFIKFWYSKELCEYLIEILPELQARPLVYQLELDRREEAERKSKKKSRKR